MTTPMDPAEFPLDAYIARAVSSQASSSPLSIQHREKEHPTSQIATPVRSSTRWAQNLFIALLQSWMCYLLLCDIIRAGCYSRVTPPYLRPPSLVCSIVSPSFRQFWDMIFLREAIRTPHTDDWHISHLRSLLGLSRERDFALRGSGASILPDFTSPTYTPPSPKSYGSTSLGINLPTITLEEQALIGDCWEFAGSTGRFGIRLSEEINITSLTITSPDPELISSNMRRKSPQLVTVWVLTDVQSLGQRIPMASDVVRRPSELSISSRIPAHFPPDYAFLPLFRFLYDAEGRNPYQTFSRDNFYQSGPSVLTQNVVVEVNSNWGASTTCIYHVGIHGVSSN